MGKGRVLLLNTSLTVRARQPNSHSNIGWEIFTDHIIELLNERKDPIVFILWGNNAIKEGLNQQSLALYNNIPHPSPYSANRGFLAQNPFQN